MFNVGVHRSKPNLPSVPLSPALQSAREAGAVVGLGVKVIVASSFQVREARTLGFWCFFFFMFGQLFHVCIGWWLFGIDLSMFWFVVFGYCTQK